MKENLFTSPRTLHFLTACAAGALSIGLKRNSPLRYPLLGMVGWEIWKGLSYTGTVERIPFEQAPELIRTATIKGIVNRWEEHGEAPAENIPVIMVHGLPTNPRAWRFVIPKIAKGGVRCLAWEQLGFGGSMLEGLGKDLSIPKQAEYLYDWLQHMGIKKAIFVGHDYGGGVIQQLLVNHPGIVAGLVLSDSVAYDNWPVKAVRLARSIRGVIKNLPPAIVKSFFLAGISNLGHENSAIKKESVRLFWEPYTRPLGPRAFAHQLRYFSSKYTVVVGRQLDEMNLDVPSRVIWGDRDPLGLSSARKLSRALNASLTKIPGGRHFTIEDHPDVIANAINEIIGETKAGISS